VVWRRGSNWILRPSIHTLRIVERKTRCADKGVYITLISFFQPHNSVEENTAGVGFVKDRQNQGREEPITLIKAIFDVLNTRIVGQVGVFMYAAGAESAPHVK
jgi:hypothetical protein